MDQPRVHPAPAPPATAPSAPARPAPPGAAAVAVGPLDLLERAEDAAAVQTRALGPVPGDRSLVFARHVRYPGFRAFGAFAPLPGQPLVGFAYGAECERGQWWFDQIRMAIVAAGHGALLDGAYAVTELHVLPAYQGRGLGLALLRRLLDGLEHPHVVLSTYDAESRARALYRGLGFSDLVTGFRFPVQAQPYALMAAPLPLPVRP
jgi:ribosomal protein S18 acetylase RimI-like enzyme